MKTENNNNWMNQKFRIAYNGNNKRIFFKSMFNKNNLKLFNNKININIIIKIKIKINDN